MSVAVTELPPGWRLVRPHEIVRDTPNALAIGPFGSNLKVSDYTDAGVPLIFVRNIRSQSFGGGDTRFVSEQKAAELESHRVVAGDVLITKMGDPPGDACVYPTGSPDAIITADCIRFAVDPDLASPELVALLFESFFVKTQFAERTKGVAQKKVSLKTFRTLLLPLPPREEQDRLINYLTAALVEMDEGTRRIRSALEALTAYRRALRQAATTGQLVDGGMTAGAEWISPGDSLPPGWEWRSLAHVTADEPRALTDGPFGSNLKSAHYTEDGPRVIRLQNVGEGEFIDVQTHISQERFEQLRAHEARAGDVVIGALGDLLPRACVVPPHVGPAIVKADCPRLRPGPDANPEFIVAALNSAVVRAQAQQRVHGLGRQRLNLTELKGLQVPLPPRAVQDAIVASLNLHLGAAGAMESALESAQRDAATLRASLLHSAFTGQLLLGRSIPAASNVPSGSSARAVPGAE